MMEEFGIPDIESAVPAEPEFFDADPLVETSPIMQIPMSSSSVTFPSMDLNIPSPEGLFNSLEDEVPVPSPVANEIKYDDESCEFDEFLIGVPKAAVSPSDKSEANEDAVNQSDINCGSVQSTYESAIESPGSSKESNSAAVVRLALPALPKMSFESKQIPHVSPRKRGNKSPSSSPEKSVYSQTPPRQSRGRMSNVRLQVSFRKRKLEEDDDDYVVEDEHKESDEEEEDDSETVVLHRSRTTKSGRQTRKIARYGEFATGPEIENSDDDNDSIPKKRTRRLNRSRIIHEDEHQGTFLDENETFASSGSEMFFPIVVRMKPIYYKDATDGTIYFTDNKGKTTTISSCRMRIKKLTEDDISKEKEDLARAAAERTILLEVCIDNFLSAQEAVKGGAKRIELCSSLAEGGLTPSVGFLTLVKHHFPEIPVFVMIRPRGGDFVYSHEELLIMSRDIQSLKDAGADGFVFGILTEDGDVNDDACARLIELAHPKECTFHRAFDKISCDIKTALDTIIDLGFNRILTSGLASTAQQGIPTLKRLIQDADGRIIILPGAGVNEKNVFDIVKKTGVREVHGSASKVLKLAQGSSSSSSSAKGKAKSKKRSGKIGVKMGAADDSILKVTDSALVAQIIINGSRPR